MLPFTNAIGSVLFYSTGLRSDTTLGVSVHCTNLDKVAAEVGVEFFSFNGNSFNDVTAGVGTMVLAPGSTRTMSTENTAIFAEDELVPLDAPLRQARCGRQPRPKK